MSIIRDESLWESGETKINWVKANMPLLRGIEEEFAVSKPFAGLKVALSVHLEAKTAYLCRVMAAGGAEMYITGSNPLSTQDDVAAALVHSGLNVFAWHGATAEEYHAHTAEVIKIAPNVIIDDGGAQDRKKPSTDHVDGLVLVDLVVYVPLSLLKTIPQKGLNMEIGDHIYQITKVHPEAGEIVLYLEMLTE